MAGSAALYQVAVALIPALLFGGATLQLREDSPSLSGNKLTVAFVLLVIFAGLLAEIVAIKGAINPNLPNLEQRYLVLVLTLGTAGVAFWIAAPLLTEKPAELDAEEEEETREATGGFKRIRATSPKALLAVALLAAGIYGQFAITDSLHSATALARFEEDGKQRVRVEHELRAAEGRDSDARAHLIGLARSTAAADRVVHIVLTRLARLDGKALSLAHNRDITPKNVNQWMSEPFQVLEHTEGSLKHSFKHGIAGLDQGERELLLLAETRVTSAVRAEMLAAVNDTLMVYRFEDACESLDLKSCRPETVKRTTVVVTPVPSAGAALRGDHEQTRHRGSRGGQPGSQPSEKPSLR